MKAIILAAGFATRLYPLTKNKAKSLLEINGKSVIDYIIEKIRELPAIDEIFIITNNNFYENFLKWKKEKNYNRLDILNDKISKIEEKLGAIGDLLFVINEENINEDIFVISGDSLFKYSLKEPFEIFRKKNVDLSIFYDVKDIKKAKRFGVALINDKNVITDFEEKPENPKSTLCSTSTYFFRKETIPLIRKFCEKEKDKDKPGLFLQYLYKKIQVYAYITKEKWIDIGTKEALEEARKIFKVK